MQIDLKWVNRNSGEDGTRVYRSTATINPSSLPQPITTLAAGISQYTDTDVVRGTTYYYRFQTFKGVDVALSDELVATALPRSGPGSQTLVAGDYEAGYFGTVAATDFMNGDEVAFLSGYTTGFVVNTLTDWLKFAYKGKILFIPKLPIRFTVSWLTLYQAGLVHGSGTGTNIGTVPPVAQGKIITKNGENFNVRLMHGAPTNPYSFTTTGANDTVGLQGSEWNDLIYRVCLSIPFSQQGANWVNFDNTTVIPATNGMQTICQETATTPTSVLMRGTNPSNVGYVGYAGTVTTNSVVAGNGWRPVLEYVPN